MDYKAYTLMAIILASLALVVPIGTTYATTNATDGATTNATDGATTNEANVPAINATGGGGNWTTFDLTAGGQTYPIQYMITGGSVENMTIHSENQTLGVTINSTGNGTLALQLPTEVIDSKTAEGENADFAAFIDNAEYADVGEIEPAADTRTLLIGFPQGAESIDVIGTSVVPEFSTIALIILAVAIIGIVIATTRHGRFSSDPRM
jgi:predicted secreted protein with PEFG-CTERM motif